MKGGPVPPCLWGQFFASHGNKGFLPQPRCSPAELAWAHWAQLSLHHRLLCAPNMQGALGRANARIGGGQTAEPPALARSGPDQEKLRPGEPPAPKQAQGIPCAGLLIPPGSPPWSGLTKPATQRS